MKKKGKGKIIFICIIVLIVLAMIGIIVKQGMELKEIKKKHKEEIAKLQEKLDEFGEIKTVYMTTTDIKAGTPIDKSKLVTKEVPATMFSNSYIEDGTVFDKTLAKVNIKANSPILREMITPEIVRDGDRIVNVVADVIPVHLKVNDYVDYEIETQWGVKAIVFAKARVIAKEANSIDVIISQEDKHRYAGVLVDRYLNNGSLLSMTVYPEPGIQTQSIPYYTVSNKVLAAMENDPNIVQVAKADIIKQRRALFENNLTITEETQEPIVENRQLLINKILNDAQTVIDREKEEAADKKKTEDSMNQEIETDIEDKDVVETNEEKKAKEKEAKK
mgnify:CR=1 FL=1